VFHVCQVLAMHEIVKDIVQQADGEEVPHEMVTMPLMMMLGMDVAHNVTTMLLALKGYGAINIDDDTGAVTPGPRWDEFVEAVEEANGKEKKEDGQKRNEVNPFDALFSKRSQEEKDKKTLESFFKSLPGFGDEITDK
jgi:hypothetical protein